MPIDIDALAAAVKARLPDLDALDARDQLAALEQLAGPHEAQAVAAYYGLVLCEAFEGEFALVDNPLDPSGADTHEPDEPDEDVFPAVILGPGLIIHVLETAERFVAGEVQALTEEFDDIVAYVERGDSEVFDDARSDEPDPNDALAHHVTGGLVVAWLCRAQLLVARLMPLVATRLANGERPAAVYDAEFGGALSSDDMTPVADRFLRAYWLVPQPTPPLTSTLWEDVDAFFGERRRTDHIDDVESISSRLDAAFAAWRAAGEPAPDESQWLLDEEPDEDP